MGSNEATSEESGENSTDDLAAFTGQFTSVAGQKLPLGTVPFMSPEHIDPSFTVDGRADIFSLGFTIFLCLCGRFPFLQPKTCPDVKLLAIKMLQRYAMAKEADQLKIPYSKGQRRGKEELITIVAKSLRKPRKERYETAGAMMKHLERIDGFAQLIQSLELYGLNPSIKLKPPRAEIPPLELSSRPITDYLLMQ